MEKVDFDVILEQFRVDWGCVCRLSGELYEADFYASDSEGTTAHMRLLFSDEQIANLVAAIAETDVSYEAETF